MSPEPCTRVREALAAKNVWGDAALLEHAKGCEVCTSELAVLKKRREFRDAFPVLSSIADEGGRPAAQAASGSGAFPRRHLLIMVAALVVIIGYLTRNIGTAPSAEEDRDGHATGGPPRYKISNLENALFDSKAEGPVVRASISRGVAAFYIERITPPQRFLLTLPDGDLEVRGTRFVVSVEEGKTAVVDVAQGTVALHLRGKPEVILEAGQRWPPASSGRPSLSFMRPPGPKDAGSTDDATPSE